MTRQVTRDEGRAPVRATGASAEGAANSGLRGRGTLREQTNRWMLRARDTIDRQYAEPLDIDALAAVSAVSPAHFIRTFKATFGETPHRYLQRRRVERAMALLRNTDRPITDICLDVGFTSLGTFSRTFSAIVGQSPSVYRRNNGPHPVPTCFTKAWMRPRDAASSFGEAPERGSS